MSDTKHTPGPFYTTNPHGTVLIREVSTDAVIATIEDGGHVDPDVVYFDSEEQEANAHLFAAGPEMLEALEDLLAQDEANRPDTQLDTEKAYAALSKARGTDQ